MGTIAYFVHAVLFGFGRELGYTVARYAFPLGSLLLLMASIAWFRHSLRRLRASTKRTPRGNR